MKGSLGRSQRRVPPNETQSVRAAGVVREATPKAHMTRPCENCPYRMDAPRRLWDRSEFVKLLAAEKKELGTTYACHKQGELPDAQRGFCAGWLLDQKRRDVPSIALRVVLMTQPDALAAFEAVSGDGLELFSSVEAMCRANGVR